MKITVTKLDNQPAEITHEITGTVYKYFNISKQNLDDSNLAKAKIQFRVNKTWYIDNNLDPSTTRLNRYSDNSWHLLKTVRLSSDSEYYYFEVETPSLSIFAVVAQEKISIAPTPSVCSNTCAVGESQRA